MSENPCARCRPRARPGVRPVHDPAPRRIRRTPPTERETMPSAPQPALATLSHDRFWEPGWVYERKLDGQRVLAVRDGSGARLYSRSGREVTAAFPEVAEALAEQAVTRFVVDGEIVAFEGSRTSFARLQPR